MHRFLSPFGLAFLTSLATLFQESEYNSPPLTKVAGTFRLGPEGTSLEDLHLQWDDNFKLSGEIRIGEEGRLGGGLTIHVAEKAFHGPSGPKLWMLAFQEGQGVWRTFPITLSGSSKGPEDDFNDLLRRRVDELREELNNTDQRQRGLVALRQRNGTFQCCGLILAIIGNQ